MQLPSKEELKADESRIVEWIKAHPTIAAAAAAYVAGFATCLIWF